MDTLRFYWPDCKGGCGVRLLETCSPQDIFIYCPECRGVNVYRNSMEPVEFLPLSDLRDAARLDHYSDNEKKRLFAVIEWAKEFYRSPPQPDMGDCTSHNEKLPDTQTASLLSSACENYSAFGIPTSST